MNKQRKDNDVDKIDSEYEELCNMINKADAQIAAEGSTPEGQAAREARKRKVRFAGKVTSKFYQTNFNCFRCSKK